MDERGGGRRIVLATLGSLGDLHPMLALALGLRARGCDPIVATHELYRTRIEALGIGFRPLRPNYDPANSEANFLSMDPWHGTEAILRQGLFPYLRETYDDLLSATSGADLLVSHSIVFPAPLLAEKTGLPWVSVVLSPISMLSVYDPPRPAPEPWMNRMWSLGPGLNRILISVIRGKTENWCEPVRQLRRELGLAPGPHPLFEGQHSPQLGLAMFSGAIGKPQSDWPRQVKQTGFVFFEDRPAMTQELRSFFDEGPAPVVFALGSAAVLTAGDFFTESAEAVRKLGCRAVLVAGGESRVEASRQIFVTAYASYSETFPRSAAVVHQGGVGTTAQCLRAGRPALVVPFAHDQPDNASRVARAGAGRILPRGKYRANRAARELQKLLSNGSYEQRAREIASRLTLEDGVETACRALLERIA